MGSLTQLVGLSLSCTYFSGKSLTVGTIGLDVDIFQGPLGQAEMTNAIYNKVGRGLDIRLAGACREVRCEAAFSSTLSAIPFSPTFGATPEFEVPQSC